VRYSGIGKVKKKLLDVLRNRTVCQ